MDFLPYLSFILVLGLMVLAHEFGHFILAKRAGIKVEEFALGYPPRLFAVKRGETEYSINLVPLGGFTKMLGEEDPSAPRSFAAASKRWRIAVLAAGSLMNIALAVLLFAGGYMAGWPTATASEVKIFKVAPGSPADQAGIRVDDVVISVGGEKVSVAYDVRPKTEAHLGREVAFLVRRNGAETTLKVVPRTTWPEGEGPLGIGILDSPTTIEPVSYPVWDAIVLGLRRTVEIVLFILYVPVMILRGHLPLELARPVGPIGIYQITAQAASQTVSSGWWFPILSVAGMIGVSLGVANLLPIPGLDGGRLLFVFLEAIRGKRISPEREGLIHMVGLGVLISLVIVVSYFDVLSPVPSIDWGMR
ncbi:MAG: site-2 protease family protein [Chloroflexi bacterium]|nr:site-2 protease family protein [Chloroflexota bacterium]